MARPRITIIALATAWAIGCIFPSAAAAQERPAATLVQQTQACAARPDVLEHLGGKYREVVVAMGLANNGGVIEVLAAPTGKTWSIIVTMPNGVTCMVAAGEGWEKIAEQAPAGEGS